MSERKGMSFAIMGIGQAGNKIADCFAEHFTALAINTAPQDLNSLKYIPEDRRIHTKVNESGGAGKDIKLGEKAIRQYEPVISNAIDIVFKKNVVDYVFIVGGLGGGTGTNGISQLSRILSKKGRKHGIIATLPSKSEGTYEQINASAGIYMIEKARERFNKALRTVILVDNEQLKSMVLDESDVKYEDVYEEMNKYIRDAFIDLYDFSQESGEVNFDTTDYKKLFDIRGYMTFGKGIIKDVEDKSNTAMIQETQKLWDNNIFIGGSPKDAQGVAVVVNRPTHLKDGKKIDQLYEEVKNYFGAIHFAPGVYATESKLKKLTERFNKKPIEVYTLLAGLPVPKVIIENLNERANKEGVTLKEKVKPIEINFDRSLLNYIVDDEVSELEDIEDDFGMFTEDGDFAEVDEVKNKKLDWNKLKELKDAE